MPMTDTELEGALRDIESDRIERKQSFADADKVRQAVCALANDLPAHGQPGVVFIGATDDGRPSGLPITDDLLRQLADIKTDGNILPPPTLTVERRVLQGAPMAVVAVWPADAPPVRFRGRIWIRVGPRRAIATAQDERVLNEKRRHKDRPFDIQPVRSASIGDLDKRLFETDYLPGAFAPDVIAANDRTYEQRLAATKLVLSAEEPVPTVLGLLVLGTRTRDFLPGAYIQFLRLEGRDLADPIVDEAAIDGAVSQVLRRIDEKLLAHNTTAVDLTSGPLEKRASRYPIAALQQFVRNAVMHRAYDATHAPVRVTWYRDRVEIASPGGPFGAVTADNFGRPGQTDYRNPGLAEALRVLGFVQKFGVGIATARRALEANGNPPAEFVVNDTQVAVIVREARS